MRAVLVDAGALIAVLDRSDAHHAKVVAALASIRDPLITVWPALTEAMHLVAEMPKAPGILLQMIEDDTVTLADLAGADMPRIGELMRKYADLPMDFADAALVYAAERLGLNRILTLDRHFEIYRLPRRQRFVVLPARKQ